MQRLLERIRDFYNNKSSKKGFGAFLNDHYLVVWAEIDNATATTFGMSNGYLLCADIVIPALEIYPQNPQDRRNSVSFYMKHFAEVPETYTEDIIKTAKAEEIQKSLYRDLRHQCFSRYELDDVMFGNKEQYYRPTRHWNFNEAACVIDVVNKVMDMYTKLKIL